MVVGHTGTLLRNIPKILLKHPWVKISYLCAKRSIGKTIFSFDNTIKAKKLPKISKVNKIDWTNINILFTALPNGEAQKIAKNIPKNVPNIPIETSNDGVNLAYLRALSASVEK